MKSTIIFFILSTLWSCNSKVTVKDELNGKSINAIEASLGKPSNEGEIKLTKKSSLHEYQSNLYHAVPNLSATDTVVIKELIWKENGKSIAIWFQEKNGEWISIDNLSWDKDVQF